MLANKKNRRRYYIAQRLGSKGTPALASTSRWQCSLLFAWFSLLGDWACLSLLSILQHLRLSITLQPLRDKCCHQHLPSRLTSLILPLPREIHLLVFSLSYTIGMCSTCNGVCSSRCRRRACRCLSATPILRTPSSIFSSSGKAKPRRKCC